MADLINSMQMTHDLLLLQDNAHRRRREITRIPSELMRQLLTEYIGFPDDHPVIARHAAARLQKTLARMLAKRHFGGGPKFCRTDTGKIYYIKRDVEEYLVASLRKHGRVPGNCFE